MARENKPSNQTKARIQVYVPEYKDYAYCYLDTQDNSMRYQTIGKHIENGNLSRTYVFIIIILLKCFMFVFVNFHLQLSG